MCNLYSNTTAVAAMRQLFDVSPERDRTGNAEPLASIFPKGQAPVVRLDQDGMRELVALSWGFRTTNTSKKTGALISPQAWNNARDDNLQSGLWRASFEQRRCLIPVSSYCETKGRNPAHYYWFGIKGDTPRSPFACAGMWQRSRYQTKDGPEECETFTMITTQANDLVRPYHAKGRMPVLLDAGDHEAYVNGTTDTAQRLLRSYPSDLMRIVQDGIGVKSDPLT